MKYPNSSRKKNADKKDYQSVLLMKVPHCHHPQNATSSTLFRQRHTFRPLPSLALASLAAFLTRHNRYGYQVQTVDINLLANITPKTSIDIREYPAILEEQIRSSRYDVLALSVMFVFNIRWLETAVSISRRYHPEAKIIVGGGYPTVFPKRCLQDLSVDAVVIGEGESTLVHLLNRFNHFNDPEFSAQFPFDGYGLRLPHGDISIIEKKSFLDPNILPVPDWDAVDAAGFMDRSGEKTLLIEAVRGCPCRCTFCNTQLTWGYRLRYKQVDRLIREMQELREKFQATLHFIDDNRSVDRNWMIEFCRRVLEERITLEPSPSSFHVHHLDKDILDLLKQCGVKTIGIGVESGSSEMQKHLRKNLDFDRVKKTVQLIKSKGFRVHINYMVGFPGERMDQIKQTLDLARELRGDSNQFLILVPYPGTELYRQAEKQNLLLTGKDDLERFDPRRSNFLKSLEWSYEQLEELIYDMNIELNFLNNPSLENPEDWNSFRHRMEDLLLRLPGHTVALIILGYLYALQNQPEKSETCYCRAAKSFDDPGVGETFHKYLSWNVPAVQDFLESKAGKNLKSREIPA